MTGTDGYVIRRMARPELDFALGLARAEGWNPGLADAGAFWQADPQGYFVGLLDGRPVASISAVGYNGDGPGPESGPTFGFIGLYIVVPELRGRGLGYRLWNAALDALKAPSIGLDGVVAQQDNYRKSGFALAMRNCRYEGTAGGAMPPGLLPLADVPMDEVLDFDRHCFPARREAFLRAWLTAPGHAALGLRRNGRLAGYGVARPCVLGSKIGPLFAEEDDDADALFHGLCAVAPQGPVFLDVPLAHAGAVRLAEAHNMRPVFETARMYRGPAPDFDLGRVFGITSFELG